MATKRSWLWFLLVLGLALAQEEEQDENDATAEELCQNRPADEYFRLTTEGDCREVVRCTKSGLKQITCPSGLAFDIDKQTCDWKGKVTNCDKLESKSHLIGAVTVTCNCHNYICHFLGFARQQANWDF
nr:unnamed protein product [Callosobruchus analis]